MVDILTRIADIFKTKKPVAPIAPQAVVTESAPVAQPEAPAPSAEAAAAPEADPNQEKWEQQEYHFKRAYRCGAQAYGSYHIQQPGDKKNKETGVIQNDGGSTFVLNLAELQRETPLPLESLSAITEALRLKEGEPPTTIVGVELRDSDVIPRITLITSSGDRIRLDVHKPPHDALRKISTPVPLRAEVEDAKKVAEKAMRNHKLQKLQETTGEEAGTAMIDFADELVNRAQLEVARRNIAAYADQPMTGYLKTPNGSYNRVTDPDEYRQLIGAGYIPISEEEGKAVFPKSTLNVDDQTFGAVISAHSPGEETK